MSRPATSFAPSEAKPATVDVSFTLFLADAGSLVPVFIVTFTSLLSDEPVKIAAEHSAYALLMFARSVASLAFSSCDVKIGMLIATKTPAE